MTANPIRNHNNQEWKEGAKNQEMKLSEYCLIHIESWLIKLGHYKNSYSIYHDNVYETYSYCL